MRWLPALALSLVCCNTPGAFYHIRIDRSFTQDEMAEVMAGIEDWERKVPVTFLVEVSPCQGYSDHGICIRAGDPADEGVGLSAIGCTDHVWNSDGGEIVVFPATPDLRRLTSHEMGHAMGLRHWGPGTDVPTTEPVIMAPTTATSAQQVTVNDIAQWYEVRHRVVP